MNREIRASVPLSRKQGEWLSVEENRKAFEEHLRRGVASGLQKIRRKLVRQLIRELVGGK